MDNNRKLTNVCIHPDTNFNKVEGEAKRKFEFELGLWRDISVDYRSLFGLGIGVEFQNEERERWETALKKSCILLSHLSLAVIVSKRFYEIPNAKEKLRELGYVPVQRTIPSLEEDNGEEVMDHMQEKILNAIRSKKYSETRIDSRGIRIPQEISNQADIRAFTFGTFKPGVTNSLYSLEDEFHDKSPVLQFYRIKSEKVERELENMCNGLSPSLAVGLTSNVLTKNGERHIPMIDFKCQYEKAYSTAQRQNMPGAIVASGNSYHFYGFKLLDGKENIDFLNSLKSQSGVDEAWVKYQLKRGYSNLRISPALGKFLQPCFIEDIKPLNKKL